MKIIYLSGIDGCGKTTQSKKLLNELRDKGLNAEYLWFRWEPSFRNIIKKFRNAKTMSALSKNDKERESENIVESEWLKFKRRIMLNPLLKKIWLMLACCDYYYAYRRKFINVKSDFVVLDRYVDDFIIDQAINLNVQPEEMNFMRENIFLKKFHFPNYKIIIDLPAKEGYERKADGTPLSYLKTREKYYLAMTGDNTLHLNGLESIDDLAEQIRNWVFSQLEGEAL